MNNRESFYTAALAQKRETADRYRREAAACRAAVYIENPRLYEIDRAMSECGAKIAATALSGDTAALDQLQQQLDVLAFEKGTIIGERPVDPKEDCPLCHDTGYIDGKLCACVKDLAKTLMRQRLAAQMPLSDCSFENFKLNYYPDREIDGINPRKKMTAVLKFCREYALRFDPAKSQSLLFIGGVGLGKTHLTLAIVSEAVEKGYDVVYGSAYNLLSAVEREHFSSEKGDSYEGMIDCDLLVIDDLGTEFISPFTLSVLYNLINSRLLTQKPTIINTNLSLSEVEKRYTPRIASRLMGSYDAHKFFGSDIRQIKCAER